MNLKEIRELLDKVPERGIAGGKTEPAGTKVRIEGKAAQPQVIHSFVAGDMKQTDTPLMPAIPMHALPPSGGASVPDKPVIDAPKSNLHIMSSPIVGTFYRQPAPDSDPFIQVGDRVRKGQIICIIEAMKLMNEIESDVDGVVREIYPQNAQAVEFG